MDWLWWRRSFCRNQSKSVDWFLYDGGRCYVMKELTVLHRRSAKQLPKIIAKLNENTQTEVSVSINVFIPQKCFVLPAGIYWLKVSNRNTRTGCEICSELTIKTPERRHWCRSGVFIINFEHISHLVLVFLLLTLNL